MRVNVRLINQKYLHTIYTVSLLEGHCNDNNYRLHFILTSLDEIDDPTFTFTVSLNQYRNVQFINKYEFIS